MKFEKRGEEIYVTLPCGAKTVISSEDENLISVFPYWRLSSGYVVITRYLRNEFGRVRQDVYLSRAIVKPSDKYFVDHADRDPLNNRRSNLRVATAGQNVKNSKKRSGKTSKYIGVSYSARCTKNPWRVFVATKKGKRAHGGCADEESAAKLADKISKENWGEFAVLNFPE